MTDTDTGSPPRGLVLLAVALAITLAASAALLGLISSEGTTKSVTGPLSLVEVPAPDANTPPCAALINAAPAGLPSAGATLRRRELAASAPSATLAWGDTDPVVLRCGLTRPPELTPTAQLRMIDKVQWLQVPGAGTATWFVVDREVYIALTVPDSAGTGPLQEISAAVSTSLNSRPLRF